MNKRLRTVSEVGGQEHFAPNISGPRPVPRNLAQILLDTGDVEPVHLIRALERKRKQDMPIEQILLAYGWVTPEALLRAQSEFWQANVIDLYATPADKRLIRKIGEARCLKHRIFPLHETDGELLIATCRPEEFAQVRQELGSLADKISMALCTEEQIEKMLSAVSSPDMIREAEQRVPARDSCRTRKHRLMTATYLGVAATIAFGAWASPSLVFTSMISLIFIGLLLQAALKLTCLAVMMIARQPRNTCQSVTEASCPLPVISVIVPLYKEGAIARDLVQRLLRLRYPRELADVILVVEKADRDTKSGLTGITLPHWVRVVEVPEGSVRTKPRALNYALSFCKGQIIGIWDAEDQPDPDQLQHIAAHFHHAPKDVGCVQGVLDFYNPRTNLLARFFTIEYAAWFRVILPALARLGLVLPLGGTTCFFRREALDHVDAWDAWNVTEDADLGVRLARHGWRTEISRTVTNEEANCRAVPWIKQRSRWLKGYALTWGVHMRNPRRLWRDLGSWRFLGFQVQFLFMLSQHILAPAVWSFWLLSIGIQLPLHDFTSTGFGQIALPLFLGLLLCTEILGIVTNLFAVRASKHRHLWPWAPFMFLYFPLASAAAWKAAFEMVVRPYYWDKTPHGIFTPSGVTAEEPAEYGDTVTIPVMGTIGSKALEMHSPVSRPLTQSADEQPRLRKSG